MFKNLEKPSDKIHHLEPLNKADAMSSAASIATLNGKPQTQEHRNIIYAELQDKHDGERYIKDWSDEKLAKDLGVPRDWISKIRQSCFGPDINEQTSLLNDARKLLTESEAFNTATLKRSEELIARSIELKATLERLSR